MTDELIELIEELVVLNNRALALGVESHAAASAIPLFIFRERFYARSRKPYPIVVISRLHSLTLGQRFGPCQEGSVSFEASLQRLSCVRDPGRFVVFAKRTENYFPVLVPVAVDDGGAACQSKQAHRSNAVSSVAHGQDAVLIAR